MGIMSGFKAIGFGIFLFYAIGFIYDFDFSYIFFDVVGVVAPILLVGYGLYSIGRSPHRDNVTVATGLEAERDRAKQNNETTNMEEETVVGVENPLTQCRYCGNSNNEKSESCPNCGAPL